MQDCDEKINKCDKICYVNPIKIFSNYYKYYKK